MQITCSHCQRQLNLPDDKVPAQAFALTCPGCKERIQVDPAQPAPSADPPSPAAVVASDAVQFEPLLATRDLDRELLAGLYPVAAVVALGSAAPEPYEAGLRHVGMKEIFHFNDLSLATQELLESDFAIMVILVDRATAPPFAPLKPLYELPPSTRRDTFVVLVADNVRSLDGQTAFYLQLNCLISTQELAKFPVHVQRALLFHLRHYRFWGVRAE